MKLNNYKCNRCGKIMSYKEVEYTLNRLDEGFHSTNKDRDYHFCSWNCVQLFVATKREKKDD